ncbi:MAG: hypothetical protein ACRCT8_05785 [Lacipirellulaceae bacterium]
MRKSLDEKLARIAADSACGDFVLADAKDADMAFGLAAPGRDPRADGAAGLRSLATFRNSMREIVEQGLVDIMLMSVSSCDRLAGDERLFENSPVTPAVRANDTTDIWLAGTDAEYTRQPSLPFRTASLDHALGWSLGSSPPRPGADLGLYSVTLNNDHRLDRETLEAYREFRVEAETKGFRHFLEVFTPNALAAPVADVGRFVVDSVVRLLAGVPRSGGPLFLKMPYFGRDLTRAIVEYDPSLVVGVLGGASGTARDAMQLVHNAKLNGARAALFGRKINAAEHQVSFVAALRSVADGNAGPEDAVRAYHGELKRRGVAGVRSLQRDLELTEKVLVAER